MPSKSKAQRKFMAAAANNPEFAKKAGIPQSVAQEYHSADKRQGYFRGNLVRRARERAQDVQSKRDAGEPFSNTGLSKKTRRRLAGQGWRLAGDMWYPPEGLPGYIAEGQPRPPGMVGGYYVPRAPEGPITPDMMAPDSIAREIYDKYGIIDPTATRYDLTSQAAMQEDPLAHLEADDPARQEYESYGLGLQSAPPAPAPRDPSSFYPEPGLQRRESPYRQQLAEHKSRIEEILGSATGGRVNYQMGGLAQAMRRAPGSSMRRGMPGGGGRFGRMNPQMMQRMRQRMMQRPQTGGRTPPMGGMGKQINFRRPPTASPEMMNAARMPGGRAAPMRGLMQRLAQDRRMPRSRQPRIGMGDQQGGLSRAMQTQTGRPPISRRAAFPGSRTNQY